MDPVGSDQASAGDKNIALKIAAAGAAVVVGLGALYLLTRSDPPKKSKKKSTKKEKERKKDKKPAKKRAEEDEEEEEEGEEGESLDWEGDRNKPPPGRRAFDPAAAGVKQELLTLEEARQWMETFHDTEDVKSAYAALVPLLADLSADAASVGENDKEGIMRSDFERWFLTGFIAGLISTKPALLIPQTLMVLRRMGAKKEDLTEAPMVVYAALLCSRTKEAMSTAFELWLSSQPQEAMKNIKNEQQLTKLFEKALTEFSEMTMSYMPLILLGSYYATRNEEILKQAMNTLERFFEALRKARVKEQIEGFYRGTAYALTRFAALGDEFKKWLGDFKTNDPTLKRALREALTGVSEGLGDAADDAAAAEGDEEEPEQQPRRAAKATAKAAPRKKLTSSGGSRTGGRTSPVPDPADE